jgi:hypothetical protein
VRAVLLLLLLLFLPGSASANDLASPIFLSPPSIATTYAASDVQLTDSLSWTQLDVTVAEPDPRGPFGTPRVRVVPQVSFADATRCDVVAVAAAGLRKFQSKLFISVTAYDAADPDRQWDGLNEQDNGAGTVDLGDGLVQGGLTVGVGTSVANATVTEVAAGQATYFDLNPLQDVSAQFDFLIRTDLTGKLGVTALVLRIRAAYNGAFNGVGTSPAEDQHRDSELTVSIGIVW